MLNFLIGLFVGAVIMDILWAWKTGVFTMIRLHYKVWRSKRIHAKRNVGEEATLDDLFD